MIKELTEFYTPKKILHRDTQIKTIEKVFDTFKEFGMASNLLIQGYSGSGKTTVVDMIVSKKNNHVFVSGASTATTCKTLKAIFDLNFNTEERLLNEGIKQLKKNPKIIIIDEVNKIRDVRFLFDDLNTIYRATACPIILISNKRTLIQQMPEDAKLTLFFDKIEFEPYNAIELKEIVRDRLDAIENKNIPQVPEGALSHICAFGRLKGSARVALDITLKCILSNDFSQKYVVSLVDKIEAEDWEDWGRKLIQTERLFLQHLLLLLSQKKKVMSSDMLAKMNNLSPSRISQLIGTFEDYGVIKLERQNMGRAGGRTTLISFASNEIQEQLEKLEGI